MRANLPRLIAVPLSVVTLMTALVSFGAASLSVASAADATTLSPDAADAQIKSLDWQGQPPGDRTKGAQVYAANCTTCHGASLEGGIGARLNPLYSGRENLQPAFIMNVLINGRKGNIGNMPARGGNDKLTDQDLRDVTAYIIFENLTGKPPLSETDLARRNVLFVTLGVIGMVLVALGLSKYNMRWIARRARRRSA